MNAGNSDMISLIGLGMYVFILIILYLSSMAGIYTLLSCIYNLMAKRFGGLKIKIKDN